MSATVTRATGAPGGAVPILAAYARISDDQAGDAQGVGRQLEDATALIERRGCAALPYVDNDVSAFKRGVIRPEFERMLSDLESGRLAGIVAYDLDRLWRQPIDLERVIAIYEQRPGLVFATLQADIDLSTTDGRMLARVMVAAANKSSADTARRVARKHAANQKLGLPAGGPRPFGFQRDRMTHNAAEAQALRDACKHLLEGGSMADLVRQWKDAGLTTTLGNPWNPSSVRATLRNPRLKGERHTWDGKHWQPVLDSSGQVVQAAWDAILPPEQFDALQALLDERGQRFKGGYRGVHKYLLTGVARCGICGGPMRGVMPRSGNFSYECHSPTHGGCGGVSRLGSKVDAIVSTAAVEVLGAHLRGARKAPVTRDVALGIKHVEKLLADALTAWKQGALPSNDYFTLRAELMEERKALTAQQTEYAAEKAKHDSAVDALAHWDSAPLRQKREILDALITAVVIEPLPVVDGRKVRKWNPELIRIVWKDA